MTKKVKNDIEPNTKVKPKNQTSDTQDLEQQITDQVNKEVSQKITNLPTSNKTVLKALYENEDGDAYLLIKQLKDKYTYDHTSGDWYYWNDHYWRLDKINHITTMIKDVIDLYGHQQQFETLSYQQAKKEGDEDKLKQHKSRLGLLIERIKILRTLKRKNQVLKLSTSGLNSLGITGEEWDKKPMLLGCRNGCFDLKEGVFKNGKPRDYIKVVSPIKFAGEDAPRDVWEKFLYEVYGKDQLMVDYIQRLLGYGISGLGTEKIFPILWGAKGFNGKTTLLEILKYVLGDFAYKVPKNFIMNNGFDSSGTGPDAIKIGLIGKRIVWFSETNKNERMDVAKLKELSGGDTTSARAPYAKRQIEFIPCALFLSITNKRPMVPADDPALWNRVHLISHDNSFVDYPDPKNPHEFLADKDLSEKLKQQAPGILMWLIEGCLLWQEMGIKPPARVLAATKDYQYSQDILGHFITECCSVGSDVFKETPKRLYKAYKEWCADVGHKPMAKNRMVNDMVDRFGKTVSVNGVRYFKGIVLADDIFS